MGGWDHLCARETIAPKDLLPGDRRQIGNKKKEPAELGSEMPWAQVQLSDIGFGGLV